MRANSMERWCCALVAAVLLASPGVYRADPPTLIRYKARLVDAAGVALTGTRDLVFEIYDQETGGNSVWIETWLGVDLGGSGTADLLLGNGGMPLSSSVLTGSVRWLQVSVDGSVLAPRQRLSSVPFAMVADRLGTLALAEVEAGVDADITAHAGELDPHTVYVREAGDTMTGMLTLSPTAGDALVTTSGNVGIGTTSPAEALDVAGNVRASGDFMAGSTTTYGDGSITFSPPTTALNLIGGDFTVTDASVRLDLTSTSGLGPAITMKHTLALGSGSTIGAIDFKRQAANPLAVIRAHAGSVPDAGELAFRTASAGIPLERMRIDEDGNVGIGTLSPSEKLEVDFGNILVQGAGSFDLAGEVATVYLGDTNHFFQSTFGQGVTVGTFGAPDGIFLQEGTGNVGIGTTSPGATLDVNGNIRLNNDLWLDRNGFDNSIVLGTTPNSENRNVVFQRAGGGAINGAWRFHGDVNLLDGNVGIGTTAPGEKMELNGSLEFTPGGRRTIKFLDPIRSLFLGANPAEPERGPFAIHFVTDDGVASTERISIVGNNGNVGIGTASPQSKLAVSGLPSAPPDASGTAGMLCITNDGNLWIDTTPATPCS